jgi:hypothetical protein
LTCGAGAPDGPRWRSWAGSPSDTPVLGLCRHQVPRRAHLPVPPPHRPRGLLPETFKGDFRPCQRGSNLRSRLAPRRAASRC